MFGRLFRKELLHHLLDFRFVSVFMLCVLLSVLSIFVGMRNYLQQLEEYQTVSENNRSFIQQSVKKGSGMAVWDLIRQGIIWNRGPEVLSPVVFGLSGMVGQGVHLQHQRLSLFEDSLFAVDPVNALFEVLDFAFIVKIVLSLCVLLLTYDAICGEKEAGTLRLYASFPVPRSTLALAKLTGSTVAVLIPFVFAYILVSAVIALSPGLRLQAGDWGRMVALMMVFVLYMAVFAASGLCVSALTHRRMTAFLGLLGLWTLWIFIVPNLALRVAQNLSPVESFFGVEKQSDALRWDAIKGSQAERKEYWKRNAVNDWDALSEAQRQALRDGERRIDEKWDEEFYAYMRDLRVERENQMRKQQNLVAVASSISPFGAISFVSMDLARTGLVQQEKVEKALNAHLIYLSHFIQEKFYQENPVTTDFSWFTYRDDEALRECLSRNALHILNLALLAILGFAGAYVAILRYDVR